MWNIGSIKYGTDVLKYSNYYTVYSCVRGIIDCCQISYTLPEILFESLKLRNLKSRDVELAISKFLYISALNHGEQCQASFCAGYTNRETIVIFLITF